MKTDEQIIEVHKRTIEAYTKKDCKIILASPLDNLLQRLSLSEILLSVEKYNNENYSIVSNSRISEIITLRQIFCLLAKRAGYSSVRTAKFLKKKTHAVVLYTLNSAYNRHEEPTFKTLYNAIEAELLTTFGHRLKTV